MKSVKLKEIFIGFADGSTESKREDFLDIFYTGNNKVEELEANKNKFMITGRKGTGKTILARYYQRSKENEGYFTKYLTHDDIILKKLLEFGNKCIDSEEMQIFIEYSMFIEIGDLIIKNKEKILNVAKTHSKCEYKVINNQIKCLQSMISDRYETGNYTTISIKTKTSILETIKSKIKCLLGEGEASSVRSQEIEASREKNHYYNVTRELKNIIQTVLSYSPIILIVDDLDEYDKIIQNNSKFVDFLISFIKTVKKLNTENLSMSNSRIIVLMRQDIITHLNSNDKNLNKIISDSVVNLNWMQTGEAQYKHPLMDLILSKVQKTVPDFKDMNRESLYCLLFPEHIRKKTPTKYLMESSFGRPRDIINYLNCIIKEFPNETAFKASLFVSVDIKYSQEFKGEIENELSLYYNSAFIQESFNIIEALNKTTFYKNQVDNLLSQNPTEYRNITSSEDFLKCMYKFGVLGNRKPIIKHRNDRGIRLAGKDYKYSWGYREDGSKKPNLNEEFVLHYALRKDLVG